MPHTPGPWKVAKGGYPNGYFIQAEVTEEEAEFNAMLIEAAPDLLKVCQTFPSFLYKDPVVMAKWAVSMVEAIHKATKPRAAMVAERDPELNLTLVTPE